MQLILRKGHIYIPTDNRVTLDKIEFTIDVKDKLDLSRYTKNIYVNGTMHPFENSFTVHLKDLVSSYMELKIVLSDNTTGESIVYTSDKHTITMAYVLGAPVNDWYPSVIKSMLDRITTLEQDNLLLARAIKEINEKGDMV